MKKNRRAAADWVLVVGLISGGCSMGTGALAAQANVPSAAETRRIEFSIPAQSLTSALTSFAEQSSLRFAYGAELTRELKSPGLSGAMTAVDALRRLLAGTGLTFRFVNESTITLEREAKASDARMLGPVRVEGVGNVADISKSLVGVNGSTDPTATEGSGSYVAPGASTGSIGPEDLREIPRSITVLTQEQLKDQNIVTMEDALRRTPGVTFVPRANEANPAEIYIRGRLVENIQVDGGAPAATYRGGVFGAFDLSSTITSRS